MMERHNGLYNSSVHERSLVCLNMAKPQEVAWKDKESESGMDYEILIHKLRSDFSNIQTSIDTIYQTVPSAMHGEMFAFCDSLKWDFTLPGGSEAKQAKQPYVAWSLEVISSRPMHGMQCFVRLCYDEGEFGFYPDEAMHIYRRTPIGWGPQTERLVDVLPRVEKRMKSLDDVSRIMRQLTQTASFVPPRLEVFAVEEIAEKKGEDAKFLFREAIEWRKAGQRRQKELDELKKSRESWYKEMREVIGGLRATKSFAKSKTLAGLREQCEKLAAKIDPLTYDYDYE